MSLGYLLSILLWSFAGFCFGYLLGGVSRDVHTIKEAVVPDDAARQRTRVRWFSRSASLGVVLIVLALLTVGTIALRNIDRGNIMECQAEVNREFLRALSERGEIGDKDRQSLDRLVVGLFSTNAAAPPVEQQKRLRSLYREYKSSIRESNELRAKFRYPDPKEFDCDD